MSTSRYVRHATDTTDIGLIVLQHMTADMLEVHNCFTSD